MSTLTKEQQLTLRGNSLDQITTYMEQIQTLTNNISSLKIKDPNDPQIALDRASIASLTRAMGLIKENIKDIVNESHFLRYTNAKDTYHSIKLLKIDKIDYIEVKPRHQDDTNSIINIHSGENYISMNFNTLAEADAYAHKLIQLCEGFATTVLDVFDASNEISMEDEVYND